MEKKVTKIEHKQQDIPCCAYARVSTMKDEQEMSLEAQEAYWEEKLKNMPGRKFCGIFADQGISGYKTIQRKEFFKMIELARCGFIKEIYTKSVSRFGRNAIECLKIIEELRKKGIAVIFEIEQINTLTCTDDLMLKLKSIFAQYELENMSKNVRFSARNNFQKGIVPAVGCYGYRIDENNHLVVNEEEAKVVRLIYHLYLRGYGLQGIIKQLEQLKIPTPKARDDREWKESSLRGILSNERYIGDALLQKTFHAEGEVFHNNGELPQYYVENDHEPILDDETFYRVQEMIKKRSRPIENYELKRYAFSSKIECGHCGSHYRHKVNKRIVTFKNELWTCRKRDTLGSKRCDSSTISDELLKEIVVDAFNEYVDTPFEMKPSKEMKEQLSQLDAITEKLKRLYLDRLITYSQYNAEMGKIEPQCEEIRQKLRNYKILSIYRKPKTKAKEYSDEIVEKHIDKIVMKGYSVEIHFKNQQIITKEFKYEHRKYRKNY